MEGSTMADRDRDALVVRFHNVVVECCCIEDALAFRSARDFLEDLLGCEPSPDDCDILCGGTIPFRRIVPADRVGLGLPVPAGELLPAGV
jgi:hypothetical protein